MRPFSRSLILVTSLALVPLAGVASAGQSRQRSAPRSQGSSSSGSSSQGSSDQGRSRTQAQPRQRESAPQQQQPQQQQSQRQQQPQRQTLPQQQYQRPQQQYQRPQQQQPPPQQQYQRPQQNDQRYNSPQQYNSRQAVPAPRDRYIDLNRDGRNDNRDSRILGPNDRRYQSYGNVTRYDGRYDRYDSRYSNYSPYRYSGPRVLFAPRENMRFSSPWFSFRALVRLPFGLTLGVSTPFPSWYRPYIVGRPGYTQPYMPYGGVTFDIQPADAELWIDGEYMGRAADYDYNNPPLTLVAGLHSVELRSGYGQPLAFDITIIPGQVIPYQGTLPYYR